MTAGQRTISGQDDHYPDKPFGLFVILTGHVNKQQEKCIFTPLRGQFFSLYVFD